MWLLIVGAVVVLVGFVAFTGAPYVPSKRKDIDRAFDELYKLTSDDVLVDIGAGDGVVLRAAARRGARAVGYEIHPVLVVIARFLSRGDKKVQVRLANFWRTHLPGDTTVVYTFGDARDIAKMYKYVAAEAVRLGRPLSFISYAFDIPGAKPTKKVGAHYLYVIKPLQLR